MVEYLIKNGAQINTINSEKDTPLQTVVNKGDIK